MNTKQVLVIRKDLNMRRGKECAQASHASMAWLTRRIQTMLEGSEGLEYSYVPSFFSEAELAWINGSFAKVTMQVESEKDLQEVYKRAKDAGLEAHLIIDSGRTEFKGVPTPTAVAIGPDEVEKIDRITGKISELFLTGVVKLY